jgi:hypothetical protein
MVRLPFVSLPLLGLLVGLPSAHAVEWWHDTERGCGLIENWKKSNRIGDLPGCDGDLPKGAPPGEVAMHDAKKLLRESEKQIDSGQTGDVEQKIAQAIEIMNRAPSDPRVNWARSYFSVAIKVLKSKKELAPKVAKLRTAYKAVADLTAQPKPDAKALGDAVTACVGAFKEVETGGVDLSTPYELTAGKVRPLREDMQECESAKSRATDAAAVAAKPPEGDKKPGETTSKPAEGDKKPAAGGSDGGVPRDKWVKKLKGDRKKVFEEHAEAFPEFEGEAGPKGAAKAVEWKYGTEVFKFKGNKLVKDK